MDQMIFWVTFLLFIHLHGYAHGLSFARRNFILGTGIASIVGIANGSEASYSAYVAREKDWAERNKKGEIIISTPDDLKRQIRAIIPNDDSSKIFCPNGSSSNVTPLMENKCSDRLAAPSVFGRTNDVVGNSIPGFGPGFQGTYKAGAGPDSSYLLDSVGGFPTYYKK